MTTSSVFSDETGYCEKYFSNLVLDSRSPSFVWNTTNSTNVAKTLPKRGALSAKAETTRSLYNLDSPYKPTGGVVLNGEDFKAKFPHDINNLGREQTLLTLKYKDQSGNVQSKMVLVEGFNPTTQMVQLHHEEVTIGKGSLLLKTSEGKEILLEDLYKPGAITEIRMYGSLYYFDRSRPFDGKNLPVYRRTGGYGNTYRTKETIPVTLSSELYAANGRNSFLNISSLKPGDVVTLFGEKYELRTPPQHGQPDFLLRRDEKGEIPLEAFLMLAERNNVIFSTPVKPNPLGKSKTNPIFDRLSSLFKSKNLLPTKIELVGDDGVRFLKQETEFISDFSSTVRPTIDVEKFIDGMIEKKFPDGTVLEYIYDDYSNKVTTCIFKDVPGNCGRDFLSNMFRLKRDSKESGVYTYYKLKKIAITEPGKPVKSYEHDSITLPNGKIVQKFYDTSPVEANILTFEVKGRDGVHEVRVKLPQLTGESLENHKEIIKKILAALPKTHADAQGVILVPGGEYYVSKNVAGLSYNDKFDEKRAISFIGSIESRPLDKLLKTFWHETGHSLALKLWNSHLPSNEWLRAMSLDGNFVSGYAMKNPAEDFAESIAAYFMTNAGTSDKALREKFSSRFQVLDKIFQVEVNAKLADSLLKQNLKKYSLGMIPIATASSTAYFFYKEDKK